MSLLKINEPPNCNKSVGWCQMLTSNASFEMVAANELFWNEYLREKNSCQVAQPKENSKQFWSCEGFFVNHRPNFFLCLRIQCRNKSQANERTAISMQLITQTWKWNCGLRYWRQIFSVVAVWSSKAQTAIFFVILAFRTQSCRDQKVERKN